ncbi:PAP2 superfamily protein [Asanoa hainanensis]|uniref:PAP2 superfamily protein n=1 Tax=Asanoa hainanensis TaxID=560556 RepID=A0A239H4T8_9ACTN|nr:phosphatase PAP2 family protein [Asanoa hainanensis]SNS76397.1 PAP2 superfamily protein [Asanoa hainanensis]
MRISGGGAGRTPRPVPEPPIRRSRWRPAILELLLVVVLFLAYKAGRQVISGHVGEATKNATSVWRFERWLHLPSELSVQHALLSHDWLVTAADSYYAYVHFPATAAVLIWLYLRRAQLYRTTRRTLAWLTAAALVVHVWFPLAPGRLVPATGLLDTGAVYGPSVYGPPDTDTLTNQYAAMPSLHVGWALVVAVALVAAGRSRWRWLWLAHPLITLLVVVSTGNHYWLDAIVAVAMVAVTAALVLPRRPSLVEPRRPGRMRLGGATVDRG